MKSYRKELWFNAPERMHFTNITSDVRQCLSESGVTEGIVLVNAMHITASVFINDDESMEIIGAEISTKSYQMKEVNCIMRE